MTDETDVKRCTICKGALSGYSKGGDTHKACANGGQQPLCACLGCSGCLDGSSCSRAIRSDSKAGLCKVCRKAVLQPGTALAPRPSSPPARKKRKKKKRAAKKRPEVLAIQKAKALEAGNGYTTAHFEADLPDPLGLPADYLAVCIAEAKRRLQDGKQLEAALHELLE